MSKFMRTGLSSVLVGTLRFIALGFEQVACFSGYLSIKLLHACVLLGAWGR